MIYARLAPDGRYESGPTVETATYRLDDTTTPPYPDGWDTYPDDSTALAALQPEAVPAGINLGVQVDAKIAALAEAKTDEAARNLAAALDPDVANPTQLQRIAALETLVAVLVARLGR